MQFLPSLLSLLLKEELHGNTLLEILKLFEVPAKFWDSCLQDTCQYLGLIGISQLFRCHGNLFIQVVEVLGVCIFQGYVPCSEEFLPKGFRGQSLVLIFWLRRFAMLHVDAKGGL